MDATAPPAAGEPLLTMPEAARRLGRSADWVKARCDDGTLRHWWLNGRRYTTADAVAEFRRANEGGGRDRVVVAAGARPGPVYAAARERLKRWGI